MGGRLHIAGALIAASLLPACTTAPQPAPMSPPRAQQVVVPLVQDRGYALVPVSVNGSAPLWFVLDTAASSSVISPATRDLLRLERDGPVDVTGAGGQSSYETTKLRSLSVGELTATDVGAVVVDLKRFEATGAGSRRLAGILGHDFLRRYDFAVDLPRNVIRLQPIGGPPLAASGAACVPNLADDPGWVVIDVAVNGAPVRAIVDTGAGRSVFNWPAARAAGVTESTPGVVRATTDAQGLGTGAAVTYNHSFADVRAGATVFTRSQARIADLPVFASLGLAKRAAVILGTNYVTDRQMTVSYTTDRVCFGQLSRRAAHPHPLVRTRPA